MNDSQISVKGEVDVFENIVIGGWLSEGGIVKNNVFCICGVGGRCILIWFCYVFVDMFDGDCSFLKG